MNETIKDKLNINQIIKRYQSLRQTAWLGPKDLKVLFEKELIDQGHHLSKKELNSVWGDVMQQNNSPTLEATRPVRRPSGTGQISLFKGDVYQLPADQWICSAFRWSISPSGGSWHGFWEAAGRTGQAWPKDNQPPLTIIEPDQQLACLNVNPSQKDGLPTIVLFGRGSRRFDLAQKSADPEAWVEEVYFDTLCLCRRLARQNKLGARIAAPLLFSSLHGIEFEKAISLQKSFALDLLRQETSVQEVMISIFQPDKLSNLLESWHLSSGDKHQTHRQHLPKWQITAIEELSNQLSELCLRDTTLNPKVLDSLTNFIRQLKQESLYLNGLAVIARNIIESWAQDCCQKAGLKDNLNLATMVSQLRGRSGSPNRSIQYLDSIRELGNIGAHFNLAPHKLEPIDLITILTGLLAMMRLNNELKLSYG